MSASTITTSSMHKESVASRYSSAFLWNVATALIALLLFGIAIIMRLRRLGLPFDRDSYDEGVYWQSLRAMASGFHLYKDVFYSQPPFFLLSIYPTYLFFGQTLWAARFGIALVSLFGFVGAFMLGIALSGRTGGLLAMLLLLVDPLYLQQSQTLQAEAPFVAFALLAIGATLLWWKYPRGLWGMCFAAVAGASLSLSILSKLFGVAALVPVGLFFLAHIWRLTRPNFERRSEGWLSLGIGVVFFLLVTAALLLPFQSAFPQMISSVITFHSAASVTYHVTQAGNIVQLETALTSFFALAALYGTIVALLRRDWRVLPLLCWFAVSAYLLWQQVPLFVHHFVALTPPLIALAAIGWSPFFIGQSFKKATSYITYGVDGVLLILALLLVISQVNAIQVYYRHELKQSLTISVTKWDVNVEHDLESSTQPGQLIMTDAQFLTALANRNSDPQLVDTSSVRVNTGYLTPQQLINEASRPDVHAILFYTGRLLSMKGVGQFYAWVMQHYHRIRDYSSGKELWIKGK